MKNKREQILRALINDRKSLVRKDIIVRILSGMVILIICLLFYRFIFRSAEQEQLVFYLYSVPFHFYYLIEIFYIKKEIQFELDENKYDIVSNIKTLRNKEMYFT